MSNPDMGTSERIYRIPSDPEFDDDAKGGEHPEYLLATDLRPAYEGLVEACPELGHLRDRRVVVLWKRAGGKGKGKLVYGTCQKPGGLLRHFTQADYVVCLSADHCRSWNPTPVELEALLYHELLHTGDDDHGQPTLYPHDFEGFVRELEHYGKWHPDLHSASEGFTAAKERPVLRANIQPIQLRRMLDV